MKARASAKTKSPSSPAVWIALTVAGLSAAVIAAIVIARSGKSAGKSRGEQSANEASLVSQKPHVPAGTVHYIRQTHRNDFVPLLPENDPHFEEIVRSQQHVLDTLIQHNAKHVLPESYRGYDPAGELIMKGNAQRHFPSYEPGQVLTQDQKVTLYYNGGGTVYPFLPQRAAHEVTLRPSSTSEVEKQTDRILHEYVAKHDVSVRDRYAATFPTRAAYEAQHALDEAQARRWVFDKRDEVCIEKIKQARAAHPGEDIFVIMGSKHTIPEKLSVSHPDIPVIEH